MDAKCNNIQSENSRFGADGAYQGGDDRVLTRTLP
jgi:hypothetical protein